ncbi:DNA (cytosine-5-)-methyltransferase [Aphanothece hegewaldii CCALA 016]|uniref:Cytosine-specific methyltransferase n=1 Tax=Aphanothece hegewaldii CCALA 016 TaxID=2107694 RepID=A0A2T1LX71_9CHRO|nr:DNA (cytosine-5-)-methyltransferase [Aphanothece hegewaldii]PSF36776.1 DNA (cytosine-5-)-methyltransferase [Aphanothece hegewaldii CCALA 016]
MLKFIDLFAGIGGFRIAFENLGCKCVFSSEWNKFSQQTYEANFNHRPFGDITLIPTSEIPDHDILTAGFPCQPFSIAGVTKHNALGIRHGFEHPTQGTLFFEIVKIIREKRPKAFILENVKNLQSHDKGKTFEVIKNVLYSDLNYHIHYQVIDARSLVPQNRKRIFIVGFDQSIQFSFPQLPDVKLRIKDILESEVDSKYTLSDHLWNYLQKYAIKHKEKGNGFGYGLVDLDGIARTLSARYYKDGAEILIPQVGKNPRRLTPSECARLMGFPETFIIPVSDNQAYRQFGNAVVPPVVEAIGKEMLKSLAHPVPERDILAESSLKTLVINQLELAFVF